MTGRQVANWIKWPSAIVATLTAAMLLGAFGGSILDVFRTPARVDAVEVGVKGHHDTLQVVYQLMAVVDSVHAESHLIQEQLTTIGFILCDLAEIPATECKVGNP